LREPCGRREAQFPEPTKKKKKTLCRNWEVDEKKLAEKTLEVAKSSTRLRNATEQTKGLKLKKTLSDESSSGVKTNNNLYRVQEEPYGGGKKFVVKRVSKIF